MQLTVHITGVNDTIVSEVTEGNRTHLGSAASAAHAEVITATYQPIPRNRALVPVCPSHIRYHALMRSVSLLYTTALLRPAGDTSVLPGLQEAVQATQAHCARATLNSASLVHVEVQDAKQEEDAGNQPRAIQIVRATMARHDIEVLFDGTMRCITAPLMSYHPTDLEQYLSKVDVSSAWLIDEIMVDLRASGSKVSQADIERALRIVTRLDRRTRKKNIAMPLMRVLSELEERDAAQAWRRLATRIFETDCSVSVACLHHFIWQVKQKLLGRHVSRHLMPIIYSPVQGSGKTTFVIKFLAPLLELASSPIVISDFTDKRNTDLYRFPVLVVDDMERVEGCHIEILKQLMTTGNFRRRRLGTSTSDNIAQCATLIGTANNTVDELVSDKTGNRRFVGLHFRNGEVAKGGDCTVWNAVDTTDFHLLWRSVNAYGPSPIETWLESLNELQEVGRVEDEVLTWLLRLDLKSEAFDRIVKREGVPCEALHELFCAQNESEMSMARFGSKMRRYASNPAVPFDLKQRVPKYKFYPIKRKKSEAI